MAIKTGGGNLLADKGEKIGLGIAAVIGVGLLALGLMAAVNRPQDPVAFSKGLENKASQLQQTMNTGPATIEDVSAPLLKEVKADAIPVVPDSRPFYDPTQPPDSRRISPVILTLAQGQAD